MSRTRRGRNSPVWRHGILCLLVVLTGAATIRSGLAQTLSSSWAQAAPMPTERVGLAAASGKDGRIYVIGGESNEGDVYDLEVYDPKGDTWSTLAPIPTSRQGLAAATGRDGRIYAIGGLSGLDTVNTVEAYDPSTNTWSTVAPMPTARSDLAATTGTDGRIYAIGGFDANEKVLDTVEVYDPSTNTWSTLPPMPTARRLLGAAAGPDGHIYAIGGTSSESGFPYLNTVEAYDPATNSWSTLASMPTARQDLAATTGLDGRIYAMGGCCTASSPSLPYGGNLDAAEVYDPSTNTWGAVAPMPTPRLGLAAATGKDGRIYTLGGISDSKDILSTVEVYAPATLTTTATTTIPGATSTATPVIESSWSTVASMPTPRDSLAAATGPDGRIYSVGGENVNGQPLSAVEAYTPSTDTWSVVAPMPTARVALAAVTGPDGRIYAIGGYSNKVLNTVEAYDAATNTWSTVAPMHSARVGLAAAMGSDGRIYAIGGFNDSGGILNTVEAYDPTSNTWSTVASMPTPRLGLAAASGPDGRIYAIGGTPDQTAATILRLVEAYNPSANAWTSVAPMPTARRLLATVTGLDGRIYAIGGFNGNILDTAEAYDAATNTWSTVAPMRIARAGLAAAAGPDGRIYAIGGSYNGSLSRVEVYNPAVPPRTPVAGATPGATSTATPTITSVPTSTPVPLTVHIKVGKKIVGAGQKQTIAVSTAPGAQVTITLTFPNGRGMQHHGTTSASGTLLWRFREPGETVRGRNHTVKVSVNVEDASGRSASASAKYATR